MTRRLTVVLALAIMRVTPSIPGVGSPVAGDDSRIGDGPVIRMHVSHTDCESGALSLDRIVERGRELFMAKFNSLDGQGRPGATGNGLPTRRATGNNAGFIRTSAPDSNSCGGCHNNPRPGGDGDFVANAFVMAQERDPVTDSISGDFSGERNTPGLMGSGAIEMLAREMTFELHKIRQEARGEAERGGAPVARQLSAKGVKFGRITARPDGTFDTREVEGVDSDLVIRPFHQKGVVASLREFTVNAFNHHHGMQAVERFGKVRTGTDDFDKDGVPDELTVGDITAATLFQASLATPGQVIPRDEKRARAIEHGRTTFETIGCADCHRPSLILDRATFSEPGPFNGPGNLGPGDVKRPVSFDLASQGNLPRPERLPDGRLVIRAYTDLKRHDLCDDEVKHFCNEKLEQNGVSVRHFLTKRLWDAGSSAPYGHRGDLTTLTEAIRAHGGEGRQARDAFVSLPEQGRAEVVEFLKSLQILPAGISSLVVRELKSQAK